MWRRSTLSLLFILLFQCAIRAQTPVVEWAKVFGSYSGDYARSLVHTSDGGFIMAGYTWGKDGGDVEGFHGNQDVGDIWVVKTDKDGNLQWQKCLGGYSLETGAHIRQTSDGGYLVTGSASSNDCNISAIGGTLDFWVVKLTRDGVTEWQQTYGTVYHDYEFGMDASADGGFFVAGIMQNNNGLLPPNNGTQDGEVIKIGQNGNLIWQKSFGGSGDDGFYDVKATPDGGCIVAGFAGSTDGDVSGNKGKSDYWVVKLDKNGNKQWQKTLGSSEPDFCWSIALSGDGGYMLAGIASANDGDVTGGHGEADSWVVKLTSSGTVVWQKAFGGFMNETSYYIGATGDGGFLVCGDAESNDGDISCNNGITDEWVFKIDGNGNLIWQKSLGGNYYDEAYTALQLGDGSFAVAGTTCSRDAPGYHAVTGVNTCGDFWLVKLTAPTLNPPPPEINIDPQSANICANTKAIITATAKYAGTTSHFQWTKNGTAVGGDSTSYSSSNLNDGDLIKCTVTRSGECDVPFGQASASITIKTQTTTIQPQIIISANRTVICPCDAIIFRATVTNAGAAPVYRWKINGNVRTMGSATFTTNDINPGDVVTCEYLDQTNCVVNGSVTSNSIAVTAASSDPPSVNIVSSMTDNCAGSLIRFTATAQNTGTTPVYQWTVNGAPVGTDSSGFTTRTLSDGDLVTCSIVTNAIFSCIPGGTALSNTIVVHIFPKANPQVTIAPSVTSACRGGEVTFTATASNAGQSPSYQWLLNGNNVGANSVTFGTTSLSQGDVVTCVVTADPLFECALRNSSTSNNLSVAIVDQGLPSVVIAASDNNVCATTLVTFAASVTNGGNASFQWQVDGQNVGSNTQTYSTSELVNGSQVTCVITPGASSCAAGPVTSTAIAMVINNPPSITLFPVDTIVKAGSQVQLIANVAGALGGFQWSPAADLSDAVSLTPTTIPLTEDATYMLTAISDKGCIATAIAVIKVVRDLYMPSAFSPNNDGKNDVYRIPPHVSLSLQNFSIYDRWGTRIFSTKNINDGWSGTIHGQPAPTGVYVYLVTGTNAKGKVFLKGTFVLVK